MEETVTRFSLVRKEEKVILDCEDGTEKTVTVREVTGQGREEYMTLMMSKVRLGPDGKPQGLKNFSGLHTKLLEMSLFDEENKLYPTKEIKAFPASTQLGLFNIAKRLASLGLEDIEEAGNDSEASD